MMEPFQPKTTRSLQSRKRIKCFFEKKCKNCPDGWCYYPDKGGNDEGHCFDSFEGDWFKTKICPWA